MKELESCFLRYYVTLMAMRINPMILNISGYFASEKLSEIFGLIPLFPATSGIIGYCNVPQSGVLQLTRLTQFRDSLRLRNARNTIILETTY